MAAAEFIDPVVLAGYLSLVSVGTSVITNGPAATWWLAEVSVIACAVVVEGTTATNLSGAPEYEVNATAS